MTAWEELKENYWRVLRRTRKSGRISQGVVEKEEAYWGRFPREVVEQALRIHISRYPDYKESYTRGIIRNLAKERGKERSAGQNAFCSFPQRDYDYSELEKQLVENL